MSTITITLQNRKFNLECAPDKHEQVLDIAAKIDEELNGIMAGNGYVSFELALVMLSLQLMAFKDSEVKISGGEALENIEKEYQGHLTNALSALSKLNSKIDAHK